MHTHAHFLLGLLLWRILLTHQGWAETRGHGHTWTHTLARGSAPLESLAPFSVTVLPHERFLSQRLSAEEALARRPPPQVPLPRPTRLRGPRRSEEQTPGGRTPGEGAMIPAEHGMPLKTSLSPRPWRGLHTDDINGGRSHEQSLPETLAQ